MRAAAAAALLAAFAGRAAAKDPESWLAGPIIGVRLGAEDGHSRGIIGLEGGYGIGPERVNGGGEWRDGVGFFYLQLDPWLYVGGTLGVGVDARGEAHGVLGVWEGSPVVYPSSCDHFGATVTAAAGLRWTGVLELYLTVKAGASVPVCFD
jgi:hypothetical protein